VLDDAIIRLTEMLFAGLVTGAYPREWVRALFSFDVRGFLFLARTVYWTDEAMAHFGGGPWKRFAPRQRDLLRLPEIGYREFSAANAEVDQAFIEAVMKLVAARGTPLLVTLAGPTAAGKTEIVDRLRGAFAQIGRRIATIEMDNFLLDMAHRDDMGIASLGREAYHFDLFMQSLRAITKGERITIPRYDSSVSSHDSRGVLKPGARPIEVEPADVVFLEGNFPFQNEDVADLVGIRIVYLTDDAVRLKRKWKRDIDYRKKYHPDYFCNRFFRTQFLRAEDCYRSQLAVCDMAVDTTDAALWVTPQIARLL
jgi:uridine kinase